MRLHRLALRAFGPFADEITVDFDDLGEDGLFLLHGQTGAGKTTILDAVAFALFGRVPGVRDTNRRLHSDHAPAHQVTQVTLVATIGGRRLRIVRSPEHQRPKKRGVGTTTVNARATLEWLDGSGPPLTRLPEIGEAVVSALGMSAEQFFQVVLLPQGDFARFLRATNEDREALLERLFDTQRFGDVEDWLRERSRESARTLVDRSAAVDRIAGQIVALAGGADAGGGAAPVEPDMAWAQARLDDARTAADRAEEHLTVATATLDAAQAAHDDARALSERRARGLDARTRLAELDSGAAALDAATQVLAAARRAAPLLPVVDDHDRAERAAAAAADECRDAEAALAGLDEASALRVADDADLAAAIERWTAESGRWEPLARRAAGRPGLIAELDRLEADIGAVDDRIANLDTALAAAPDRRAAAADAHAAAITARAELGTLRAERDRIDTIRAALAERAALADDLDRARRAALTARENHTAAREELVDVRERRVAGMAAELASGLTDGDACVVCGSVEHPAPATADGVAPVSKDDEVAAGHREQQAADRRGKADTALARLIERRTHLDGVIGEATAESIATEHTRLVGAVADAERADAQVPAWERSLVEIDEEIQVLQRERAEADTARSGLRERRTALRRTLDDLDAEVAEATGGRVGVAERRAELAELCRLGTRVRETRSEAARAERHRDEVAGRLAAACTEADFADSSAVRQAAASAQRIGEWEAMLSRAAALRSAAEATLADPAVADALAAGEVDVENTQSALDAARAAHSEASGVQAVAARRVTDLESTVAEYWAAVDALAPVADRHAELQGLAELVAGRGQNSRRMTLRSYVLAARLEEVLVAASARLRHMSAGRYEFAHSDAVGPRGRRGGLGIEVRDEYTGTVRAATTLSGGETFFASLALALGLADVVSAEAGGRVLDTIFIDEGFGTLDPEALDLVMGVLDELRSGGRVVGVVSHVDELRARIPAQLHVLRTESGSHIRTRTPLGAS
ncbi:SMC family ATPase [Gordonia sinesedis]